MRPDGIQSLTVMMRGRATPYAAGFAALVLGILVLSGCALHRANRAPLASFTVSPAGGYRPLDVAFDASGSTDPDGDRLTYTWSFGDGATGAGVQTTHTFEHAGVYDIVLRVADPEGLQGAVLATVEVLDVPEGSVVLRFAWAWGSEDQRLDFAVPWNLYLKYRGRLRTPLVDNYQYADFVEDSLDDPTLEDLADDLAGSMGGGDQAFAEYALAFVQGAIAYNADPPDVEWPLYPLETLVDGEGDCEDTAILFVSLLRARGVSCQLAFVDTDDDGSPDHVLALVEISSPGVVPPGATVFELDGTLYAVAETASGYLGLGLDPWGLEVDDLMELWLF
jgi:PKD repeat protein